MIDATFRCRKCSAVLFTGECLVTPVGTAAYSEDGSPLSTSSVTIAANKGPFDSVHHPNPSSLSATITSAGKIIVSRMAISICFNTKLQDF